MNKVTDLVVGFLVVLGSFSLGYGVVGYFNPPAEPTKILTQEDYNYAAVYKLGPHYTVPGKFQVIDTTSGYYKCKGYIYDKPHLDKDLTWTYGYANMVNCVDSNIGARFREGQLKRIGNLSD